MVTRAMRLALIMHSYNDDNLRHVLGDGLTIPDMELYEKGKITDAYNKGKTYRYVPYDDYLMVYKTKGEQRNAAMRQLESEITSAKEFIKGLEKSDDFTDYEKRFLTSAKKMFHEYTGGVINDTSQVLKGYKIARVKNYFPIKSDPNFTKQDYAGLVRDGSIEGMGFLKNRVASKNPILLEDITNVILRQTNNTALYGGMAIPIRNLNMVLNITSHDNNGYNQSVKSALAQTWGETDNKFLKNLITDLQMGRHQDPTIFDSMRSKFAGATLTLNLKDIKLDNSMIVKKEEGLPSTIVLNKNDYQSIYFNTLKVPNYDKLKSDGFKDNYKNYNTNNIQIESFDYDKSEYYTLFKIYDVNNKVYYSNLTRIK
jgi:hypothetical protein